MTLDIAVPRDQLLALVSAGQRLVDAVGDGASACIVSNAAAALNIEILGAEMLIALDVTAGHVAGAGPDE